MSNVLAEICAKKRAHVEERKRLVPVPALRKRLDAAPAPRGFADALAARIGDGGYALIAEIKKASPSAGLIRPDFDPEVLARAYGAGGASCLSVLTDTRFFQGSDEDLWAARREVDLPVLRKDFMLDPYQILESRHIGADCVLLIMAAVSDASAAELAAAAAEVGLDVLAEVHDREELERALRLGVRMIGINNRNLKTLKTDLATTERLAPEVPSERLVVAESGIRRPEDLDRLAAAGARCFLVGERLMREPDVAAATRRLLRLASFTHLDAEGRARMVDVADKDETDRVAVAGARVVMRRETLERIRSGDVAKGDVRAVARLAGIMAAKRTAELIPLCHPLMLTSVAVDLACAPERSAVEITATCRLHGRTGVEMEALTAASVAALTVYDMCKAVDRGMVVTDLRLLRKSGGRSGDWEAEP
ncbi:MAG: indole-3-glycerol phosphate synthase TrpC [Alphaproteobacteria bacterium]|nr:indole-3-glycerol phosphate synthase TrpC [Alphaproteobacteria bacterium]